jgi:hypothetical protein
MYFCHMLQNIGFVYFMFQAFACGNPRFYVSEMLLARDFCVRWNFQN